MSKKQIKKQVVQALLIEVKQLLINSACYEQFSVEKSQL